MIVGTYLKVEGCLGAALVGLLNGDMDVRIVDSFVMDLGNELTLVLVNVNDLGGGGGGEEGRSVEKSDGFKQVFPCDVNS